MAEPGIDQSKLPGVKEVCRDFAVLEDHTLAHSLQEQEIEHHLASNIQRTRLVQHDLLVAKKLQEEEDLKARARIQKLHKHLEHQDCEIAQEIQEKLVIEAEQRRRQEEKDEDIARILQERELKEKKKQKQQQQLVEGPGHEPYEDGYYQETGGMGSRGARDATYGKMQADVKQLELQDAQIARRLQEEELRATRTDMRAAQVAQDEEIARLLMAEEKKAYKKAKEREKVFSDKRRQEPEWQTEAGEHVRPRSRDAYEGHRSKSDKPARPLPPSLSDHVESECRRPQHSSARPAAKLESAQKGSSHWQ
ncbi:coiled-coil domain-containing protein 50 isoform X3 [Rhinatrema bivittatum]|uniref:coiled-coil domain-containing protein 50 isoform X3 n=1 Tax=Rhinatrema bivittatum TaxID=194408 RepID=UPI00112DDD76|nr:coiled-coil domain-containing protein 50 isoform X3 [Rhinatrema bivittatum]